VKVLTDNSKYVKVVRRVGKRENLANIDLSDILTEEVETEVKHLAELSMGTEVSDEDISNVVELCEQVVSITEYREQLFEYLKNRMQAIAPNLTTLIGEMAGNTTHCSYWKFVKFGKKSCFNNSNFGS